MRIVGCSSVFVHLDWFGVRVFVVVGKVCEACVLCGSGSDVVLTAFYSKQWCRCIDWYSNEWVIGGTVAVSVVKVNSVCRVHCTLAVPCLSAKVVLVGVVHSRRGDVRAACVKVRLAGVKAHEV